jgi:DNA polymerase-3 subunit alpha
VLLASVGFAMDADQQAKSANQVSLFGGDDSDLDAAGIRQGRAVHRPPEAGREKIALGFYLSGHMFDSFAPEARRFARTKLADWNRRASRACCAA